MKIIKPFLIVCLVPILLGIFVSCTLFKGVSPTGELLGSINNETMKVADLPSPETHTMVYFGAMGKWLGDKKYPISRSTTCDAYPVFLQLNPAKAPMVIVPTRLRSSFCFLPMEGGLSVKIVRNVSYEGNVIHFIDFGLQKNPISFVTKKHGLQYIGAYLFDYREITEEKDYDELMALEDMLETFKGSNWEPLITARINEINQSRGVKNESKK